jgi:hypothetical protein
MTKLQSPAIRSAVLSSTASLRQKLKIPEEDIQQLKTVSAGILAVLAAVGVVGVMTIAPNMVKVLTLFYPTRRNGRRWTHEEKQQKVIHSLYYLKHSGMIEMQNLSGDTDVHVRVLPRGLERLARLIRKPTIPKPSHWLGTWWLAAADIPTKTHRHSADVLRQRLKELGWFPLQRTLWIYPYDPRRVLAPLLQELGLGHYVTLMEVCRLDKADLKVVRRHFKL